MSDVNCAQAAVNFYAQRSPLLRGHIIHVQFSNHDQLLPDDAASIQVLIVESVSPTGAVQRGGQGAAPRPPVKILPLPCGPPMKFMIKHNLPLVTCGSLWQHRSVPPSCNYGPPTVPPKCKPQNRHCSSTILSKTLWFYHSLQRKQWLSLSIPNWSSVYIMKVVYIEISACTIFYKETGISTVDFTETFPFYHIYGQPYTPDYHQQDKQTDRRNFFTIANHYKVTVG